MTQPLNIDITFIVDESGSMHTLASDTVGGINAFLAEQKALPDPATISMVMFNRDSREVFSAKPLSDVSELKASDYRPSNSTALLDCVGNTLLALTRRIDDAPTKPDKVVVMVITDGHENASLEFTVPKVKALIQECADKGWTFTYMGANVDAFAEASNLGIDLSNTSNYKASADGIDALYSSVSSSIMRARKGGDIAFTEQERSALGK